MAIQMSKMYSLMGSTCWVFTCKFSYIGIGLYSEISLAYYHKQTDSSHSIVNSILGCDNAYLN